jgi:cellulose synthase/poly-beta-1,6-N-acetylglucosamine synthase-like glycosyltransferase
MLEIIVWFILTILVIFPVSYLFLQIVVGSLFLYFKQSDSYLVNDVNYKILMPAHNEELIIRNTLLKLKKELGNLDNILVVADNCNDKTALIARDCGACVLERSDNDLLGKGYALDAGIAELRKNKPSVVVVLDADCEISNKDLLKLISRCAKSNSVTQALYLMKAPDSSGVSAKLAEFAWMLKNKIRPAGLSFFDLGCQLQGSGMSFPWRIFEQVSFASGNLVEDLELGLTLNDLGERVLFEPDSQVLSYFPLSVSGVEEQRVRWEHGHLATVTSLPKILAKYIFSGKVGRFFTAFDVMIPPITLFIFYVFSLFFVSVFLVFIDLFFPVICLFLCISFVFLGVFFAWFFHGRNILSIFEMLFFIRESVKKINIYKRFFTDRKRNWVRTDRGD